MRWHFPVWEVRRLLDGWVAVGALDLGQTQGNEETTVEKDKDGKGGERNRLMVGREGKSIYHHVGPGA